MALNNCFNCQNGILWKESDIVHNKSRSNISPNITIIVRLLFFDVDTFTRFSTPRAIFLLFFHLHTQHDKFNWYSIDDDVKIFILVSSARFLKRWSFFMIYWIFCGKIRKSKCLYTICNGDCQHDSYKMIYKNYQKNSIGTRIRAKQSIPVTWIRIEWLHSSLFAISIECHDKINMKNEQQHTEYCDNRI